MPLFLAGAWEGEKDGDPVEEHWTAELDGSMLGMMRWHRGGRLHVSEHMEIEVGEPTVLRIRHFRAGLLALEDAPLEFHLESATDRKAVWRLAHSDPAQRMVYQRDGNRMAVHFEAASGQPLVRGTFRYVSRAAT